MKPKRCEFTFHMISWGAPAVLAALASYQGELGKLKRLPSGFQFCWTQGDAFHRFFFFDLVCLVSWFWDLLVFTWLCYQLNTLERDRRRNKITFGSENFGMRGLGID